MNKTHEHLQMMGARIAPKKSLTFSSCPTSRKWLREHKWRRIQTKIPVINDYRDVGAHLNATKVRKVGTTLSKRMQAATSSTERLNFFRAPYEQKGHIIRAKMLAKGLYGCETSPIN